MKTLACLLVALTAGGAVLPVSAAEITTVSCCTTCEEETPQTRQGQKVWFYTNIGGVCFKRLKNVSRNEWVGGWVPCSNVLG